MENSKEAYMPLIIERDSLADFLEKHPNIVRVDAYTRQLRELFFIDNEEWIGKDKQEAWSSDAFKKYLVLKQGSEVYVYYPWNGHLVTTVGESDYFKLKTNRNQDLITSSEQLRLRDFRVAVFGLSVGSNVVIMLTQTGISNNITIADFDELDTTNLNRILAGIHQIGLNKTTVTARRIHEDNPFAHVTALSEGVDARRLTELLEKKEIDCIVDEVDDMPFKIMTRKLAMKYQIPVVMVTDNGDGVVLHVERYDLGVKTIFGKEPTYFDEAVSGTMTKEAAGRMIMQDIVGGVEKVDPAMLRSVQRVLAKKLVSWSQLGSAALLGGVVATYIIKQIALRKNMEPDIRAYISPASGEWLHHTA